MLPVSARLRVKALNEYAVDAQSKLEYKPHTTIEFRESLKFLDKTQEHVGAFKSFPLHKRHSNFIGSTVGLESGSNPICWQ